MPTSPHTAPSGYGLPGASVTSTSPGAVVNGASATREPQSQTFVSAGVRIHFVEAGAGDPVVLTHGFSSNIEQQWMHTGVFDKLADRHRVIAIDGRGHGQSDKPHDPAMYGPQAAQDVVRLLDHIGLRQAHIVGYSLGAILNGYLVTQAPLRFKTCVLVGATPRFRWTAQDQAQLELEAAEMHDGSMRAQILRLWPEDEPRPSEDEIARISAGDLAGQDCRALAASRRGGSTALVNPAQVAAIRVPTLGIVGSADPYLSGFQAMQALNPSIELITIQGASHSDTPARPELVEGLLRFLARYAG